METTIPFSGFYETIHMSAVGNRALMEYGCDNEEHAKPEWTDRESCTYDTCSSKATSEQFKELERDYCREYVKQFAELVGIPLKYNDMTSPREYNFTTDRIFAEISEEEVEKLKREIDPVKIREYVKRRFTSYDGFSSFYDSSYDNWLKQPEPFDHNQIGALIACKVESENGNDGNGSDWEIYLAEDVSGNF